MTKLFVVGIPRDMDELELTEIFSAHGPVEFTTIVTDKDSGESKGFAFVHMENQAGADRAIMALDGAEIDERKISVRIAGVNLNEAGKHAPVIEAGSQRPLKKKRPRIGK